MNYRPTSFILIFDQRTVRNDSLFNLTNQYTIESNQILCTNILWLRVICDAQTSLNENKACLSWPPIFSSEMPTKTTEFRWNKYLAKIRQSHKSQCKMIWKNPANVFFFSQTRKKRANSNEIDIPSFVSYAPVDWNHKSFVRIQIAS